MSTRPKLLLADDNARLCAVLVPLLSEAFEVRCAASLAEASALLRGERFDLVLTDYDLGDGTGRTLLLLARAAQPQARRALLSANPPPDAAQFADVVFEKPPPGEFVDRLRDLASVDRKG